MSGLPARTPIERKIIILPGLLDTADASHSVLAEPGSALRELVSLARVVKLNPAHGGLAEACWVGLDPESVHLSQGALAISALGVDPPERSVHFDLSLLSVGDDGTLAEASHQLSAEDARTLAEQAKRLETKSLIPVIGQGVDHGLVWLEGSDELATTPPASAFGKPWNTVLPEGDGEPLLRAFIDDSLNLLNDHEINQRRRDEGLPPANILWPWGQGFRRPLPNLALRRGEIVTAFSPLARWQGFMRLVGYRHADRSKGLRGVFPAPRFMSDFINHPGSAIFGTFGASAMRKHERWDHLEELMADLDEHLFTPLVLAQKDAALTGKRIEWLIHCPGPLVDGKMHPGLALTSLLPTQGIPFDERVLDDPKVPSYALHEPIRDLLES